MIVRLTRPLDKRQKFLIERLPKIQQPVQYFIAIHQEITNESSKMIGKTEIQRFDIKT